MRPLFWQDLSNICTPHGQHRLMMASGCIFRSLALRAWDTAPTSRQSQAVVSAARSEELRPSLAQLRRVLTSWMLTGVGTAVLLWEVTQWSCSWNHKVSDYLPLCQLQCEGEWINSTNHLPDYVQEKGGYGAEEGKEQEGQKCALTKINALSTTLDLSLCNSET